MFNLIIINSWKNTGMFIPNSTPATCFKQVGTEATKVICLKKS